MPQSVVFSVVEDDLGHIVIDVATPFRWITKRAKLDSLRLEGPSFALADQEASLIEDLGVCPRARLLAERFEAEGWAFGWVEIYWDGLEVFLSSGTSMTPEEACDQLWDVIVDIADETWSGKQPVRKDVFGLFPRSLGKTNGVTSRI